MPNTDQLTAERLDASGTQQRVRYRIADMCCPTEERLIRNRLQDMPGVDRLDVDLVHRVVTVSHHLAREDALADALASIGMRPVLVDNSDGGAQADAAEAEAPVLTTGQKAVLALSAVAAAASEALAWHGLPESSPLVVALALVAIVVSGLPTLRKGWIALRSFTLNINFLMSLAVIGALALGQWPEAAMVVVLFAIAETVESMSMHRVRRSVHGLLSIAPDTATVRTPAGDWKTVQSAQVTVGDHIRVKPGERVALDGVVVDGESAINQAPITGESMPVEKRPGDTVFAGTINEHGALDVRVTANSGASALARIVRVIEETRSRQAPTQRFIDRFARWYTPAVVAVALLIALIPPLAFGLPVGTWVYKALVMLVIACPCALVISTPVTVVSGLTAAARRGILVKGGEFLESGARLRAIALDKTGTLTRGLPVVRTAESLAAARPDDVLVLAASLNAHSTHPLARAVREAAPRGRMLRQVRNAAALPGRGVKGDIGGKTHYLGNGRLFEEYAANFDAAQAAQVRAALERLESQGQTAVVLFAEDQVLGVIGLADELRPDAAQAVRELAGQGVRAVMLTGDNAITARAIAASAGIATHRAELLPEHKLDEIKRLQSEHGAVGMVGDGINDAPALAQADIGFAMGAAGSDTAIETADVALMDDDLRKLSLFIQLSRSTRRVLMQNIAAALLIKAVFFALALAGVATLWMAVFADLGGSLLVVGNGLRLLKMGGEPGAHGRA